MSTTNTSTADETVWYHGTRRGFRGPGGLVLPRASTGATGTTAPVNPGKKSPEDAGRWCYVTRDIDVAWAYAISAVGRGEPKVLVVDPHGEMMRDPEHGPLTDAWRCEWATVRKVIRSMYREAESVGADH